MSKQRGIIVLILLPIVLVGFFYANHQNIIKKEYQRELGSQQFDIFIRVKSETINMKGMIEDNEVLSYELLLQLFNSSNQLYGITKNLNSKLVMYDYYFGPLAENIENDLIRLNQGYEAENRENILYYITESFNLTNLLEKECGYEMLKWYDEFHNVNKKEKDIYSKMGDVVDLTTYR